MMKTRENKTRDIRDIRLNANLDEDKKVNKKIRSTYASIPLLILYVFIAVIIAINIFKYIKIAKDLLANCSSLTIYSILKRAVKHREELSGISKIALSDEGGKLIGHIAGTISLLQANKEIKNNKINIAKLYANYTHKSHSEIMRPLILSWLLCNEFAANPHAGTLDLSEAQFNAALSKISISTQYTVSMFSNIIFKHAEISMSADDVIKRLEQLLLLLCQSYSQFDRFLNPIVDKVLSTGRKIDNLKEMYDVASLAKYLFNYKNNINFSQEDINEAWQAYNINDKTMTKDIANNNKLYKQILKGTIKASVLTLDVPCIRIKHVADMLEFMYQYQQITSLSGSKLIDGGIDSNAMMSHSLITAMFYRPNNYNSNKLKLDRSLLNKIGDGTIENSPFIFGIIDDSDASNMIRRNLRSYLKYLEFKDKDNEDISDKIGAINAMKLIDSYQNISLNDMMSDVFSAYKFLGKCGYTRHDNIHNLIMKSEEFIEEDNIHALELLDICKQGFDESKGNYSYNEFQHMLQKVSNARLSTTAERFAGTR